MQVDVVTGAKEVQEPLLYRPRLRSSTPWYTRPACLFGISLVLLAALSIAAYIGFSDGQPHRRLNSHSYRCPSGFNRSEYDTVFFVVGDWGRENSFAQRRTADLMSAISNCMHPEFVISTGDNFYETGMKSADDPTFKKSFSEVYTAPGLQVPWYAVLGNHDYGDMHRDDAQRLMLDGCLNTDMSKCSPGCCVSPLWQVGELGLQQDRRWHCSQDVVTRTFNNGTLDIIFIDTNPFIGDYRKELWADAAGGISSQNPSKIRQTIINALKASKAPMKIVVGHHPLVSYGPTCTGGDSDCQYTDWLKPYLENAGVMAYFDGHDHTQQVIKMESEKVTYLVSGAGSKTDKGAFDRDQSRPGARYLSDDQGFMAVTIKGKSVTVYVYSASKNDPDYVVDLS